MKIENLACLRVVFAASVMIGFSLTLNSEQGKAATGTVNILLANENGLVAVTDSMITYSTTEHLATGLKIYQIDDRTICTIAGLYTLPGPLDKKNTSQSEALDPFFVRVPSLINYYKKRVVKADYFSEKFRVLAEIIAFDLSSGLQALAASNPSQEVSSRLDIELSLVGYDRDGELKIAGVLLHPKKTTKGVEYFPSALPLGVFPPQPGTSFVPPAQCEKNGGSDKQGVITSPQIGALPSIRTVGNGFVCQLAGVTDQARRILSNPGSFTYLTAVGAYAKKSEHEAAMSLDEMRNLALELERQTALREALTERQLVGGEPDIAILSSGKVSQSPRADEASLDIGKSLHNGHVGGEAVCDPYSKTTYNYQVSFDTGTQRSVELTDCKVDLAGILFHDSIFHRGAVFYAGAGPIVFPDSNRIDNSVLYLGRNVDLNEPSIRHLICAFEWKAVLQERRIYSLVSPRITTEFERLDLQCK